MYEITNKQMWDLLCWGYLTINAECNMFIFGDEYIKNRIFKHIKLKSLFYTLTVIFSPIVFISYCLVDICIAIVNKEEE